MILTRSQISGKIGPQMDRPDPTIPKGSGPIPNMHVWSLSDLMVRPDPFIFVLADLWPIPNYGTEAVGDPNLRSGRSPKGSAWSLADPCGIGPILVQDRADPSQDRPDLCYWVAPDPFGKGSDPSIRIWKANFKDFLQSGFEKWISRIYCNLSGCARLVAKNHENTFINQSHKHFRR